MFIKKWKYSAKIIGAIWFFFLFGFFLDAQTTVPQKMAENIKSYNSNYPQQKVYLHLDKSYYYPGENVWFKVYLINAVTHFPDTLSKNLYVELFDSYGNSIAMRIIELENGLAKGDVKLPDSIPDGNYMFRAYTTWMLNFNKDFIHEVPVYIENLEEKNYISRRDVYENRRFNRRLRREKDDYKIHFYPEGGNIFEGSLNRVAFKAKNGIGRGVDIKGQIKSNSGKVIDFKSEHYGMGYFEFTPSKGKSYHAKITFPDGSKSKFDLPKIYKSGYLLRVDNSEDSDQLNITIEAVNSEDAELVILGITRGAVKYFKEFTLKEKHAELTVPKDVFGTGVSQITLFKNDVTPLAERLVFIDNNEYLNATLEKDLIKNNDTDRIIINIKDSKKEAINGSFSMAVTKIPENYSSQDGIMAELLISSDLKGYIENPDYYFDRNNDNAHRALDILMMTHGWRRFDIEKVVSGEFPAIEYGLTTGLTIGGRVSTPSARKGIGFAKVEMMVHGDAKTLYNTEADKNGKFTFSDIKYYDSFNAEFTANHQKRGSNLRIEISRHEMLESDYRLNLHTKENNIVGRGDDWERVKRRPPKDKYRDDARFSPSSSSDSHYLNNPDQVIYLEDIRGTHNILLDVLRGRVTGVTFDPSGQIIIRGPSSILGSSKPSFFIDQIQIDQNRFLYMNSHDIERVEIFKGTSAALLGVRGGTGAFMAYSKQGGDINIRSYIYQFMGYLSPREFYVQGEDELNRQRKPGEYQTLLWDPSVKTTTDGNITIDFPRYIDSGRYKIRLEGMDDKGRLGSMKKIIDLPYQKAD